MSKAKKDPDKRIRKIGQREETIEIELTDRQISEMKDEVMALLDHEETVEKRKEEASKNFASQLKTSELQRNELRRKISARKVRKTIIVEEHLTEANEVVRIRQDTGDKLGARTATPRELQEDLPLEGDPAPQQSDASEDPPAGMDAEEFGSPAS